MTMLSEVQKEFAKLEKSIANDNSKLQALRMVIKQYATAEYPSSAKLNTLIMEYLNTHNGHAGFQDILECIRDHQITIAAHKISVLLTNNHAIEYDKKSKQWRLKEAANRNISAYEKSAAM